MSDIMTNALQRLLEKSARRNGQALPEGDNNTPAIAEDPPERGRPRRFAGQVSGYHQKKPHHGPQLNRPSKLKSIERRECRRPGCANTTERIYCSRTCAGRKNWSKGEDENFIKVKEVIRAHDYGK